MEKKIQNKIAKLTSEIEQLVTIRDGLNQQLHDVGIRITQIVGAIKEFNEILEDELESKSDEESDPTNK